MASADSVTVSIGAESSGMFRRIDRVSRVDVSASEGITPLRRGNSSTSSNVMPSATILESRVGGGTGARDSEGVGAVEREGAEGAERSEGEDGAEPPSGRGETVALVGALATDDGLVRIADAEGEVGAAETA